jgi:hypothetical protein
MLEEEYFEALFVPDSKAAFEEVMKRIPMDQLLLLEGP